VFGCGGVVGMVSVARRLPFRRIGNNHAYYLRFSNNHMIFLSAIILSLWYSIAFGQDDPKEQVDKTATAFLSSYHVADLGTPMTQA
jgi:hypothetical protein